MSDSEEVAAAREAYREAVLHAATDPRIHGMLLHCCAQVKSAQAALDAALQREASRAQDEEIEAVIRKILPVPHIECGNSSVITWETNAFGILQALRAAGFQITRTPASGPVGAQERAGAQEGTERP